ncbi:hypothetical protein QJS10_CPA03g02194 [Acorus calamus]|uniref:Uncharacterized protein n=1 Tax=Acorus calamus TaxID=4465 RepID=A0AAV9F4Z6_ACOCL|nr:hypothetical protein QJS10_CPA03g02194 [Acorus calamus]
MVTPAASAPPESSAVFAVSSSTASAASARRTSRRFPFANLRRSSTLFTTAPSLGSSTATATSAPPRRFRFGKRRRSATPEVAVTAESGPQESSVSSSTLSTRRNSRWFGFGNWRRSSTSSLESSAPTVSAAPATSTRRISRWLGFRNRRRSSTSTVTASSLESPETSAPVAVSSTAEVAPPASVPSALIASTSTTAIAFRTASTTLSEAILEQAQELHDTGRIQEAILFLSEELRKMEEENSTPVSEGFLSVCNWSTADFFYTNSPQGTKRKGDC